MSGIDIRVTGRAGRITLDRPAALNALSYQMCLDIEAALEVWRGDDAVDLIWASKKDLEKLNLTTGSKARIEDLAKGKIT